MNSIIKYIIITIIILIILIILIIKTIKNKTLINTLLNILNINIKVKGKHNLKDYKDKKIILMANHYSGVDYLILDHAINYNTNYSKKIHTIVKHNVFGDKNDDSFISNFLSLFKTDLYKFLNFLPYIRESKKSGSKIKEQMINILNNNNTVLIFPEGTGTKNGIPNNFKSGSFILCAENNIGIIPITLKLNKNVGGGQLDKVYIKDWFNLNAEVIIHKPIFSNDWVKLKEKVFNKIKKPFIIK
jgi:1-acyl-sn-glycerol-3-phosphate acyltransferase